MNVIQSNGRFALADELLDSEPPNDKEAERALLGSLMLDAKRLDEVASIVNEEDMYDPAHASLLAHIVAARVAGEDPGDTTLLYGRIKSAGDDSELSARYLAELAEIGTAVNAKYYAERVVEKARLRRLRTLGERTLIAVQDKKRPSAEIWEEVSESFGRLHRVAQDGEPFESFTGAELCAMDHSVDYLIDGVMVRGQPGIGSGVFKSLKTSVFADAAVSISTGTKFLETFNVDHARPVLMMSAESGLRKLTTTCQRVSAAKGLDFADNKLLRVSPTVPSIGSLTDEARLRRTIEKHGAALTVIDPGYRALQSVGDSASNVFKVGEMLARLDDIAESTGTTIYIVHHNQKHSSAEGVIPELRHISMAGFAEWARQWLLLGPRKAWNPETREHWLWLVYGGSEEHAGCWGLDVCEGRPDDPGGQVWDASLVAVDDAVVRAREQRDAQREEIKAASLIARDERDRKAICDALASCESRRAIKAEIKKRSKLNNQRFKPAFEDLVDGGDIFDAGTAKASNNHICTLYELNTTEG